MKLLGSTEEKITKEKIGKNVPRLEIPEEIFVCFSSVNNSYH